MRSERIAANIAKLPELLHGSGMVSRGTCGANFKIGGEGYGQEENDHPSGLAPK